VSWEAKKRTASGISNDQIDHIFDVARAAGAYSGKVSGAGGGGFLFFTVPPEGRPRLMRALAREAGVPKRCGFTESGAQAWRV
jgi:D-glycero-alpha-D-manno-heptose-7-phosphate kinase